VSESKPQVKPFEISKRVVWEAYLRVKANKGAAGVDAVTIEQYEQNLTNNLVGCHVRVTALAWADAVRQARWCGRSHPGIDDRSACSGDAGVRSDAER
jgi:hypothetical protein